MQALTLELYLESPALLTGVANAEENSSVSLSYIPGGAIRGAAIAAYLRRYPQAGDLAADDGARALFFDERVLFLNGYPAHPLYENRRALPTPLSWHVKKDELDLKERTIWDFALFEEPETVDKPKTERMPFFWPAAEEGEEKERVSLLRPRRRGTVHNGSDRPMEKSAGNSNVFRYDALEAGQRFIAYVLSEDEALLQTLRDDWLPDGRVRLGGSKTAGYGDVRLTGQGPARWAGEYEAVEEGEWTIITLLSDALLLTVDGQPTTDLHAYLQAALQRALPPPERYARAALTGGFNRKWGLPLPQAWALGMGSVYAYPAAALRPDDLAGLVAGGVGLRRDEGYGRLGVNVVGRDMFQAVSPTPRPPDASPLSDASRRLAGEMARRRLVARAAMAVPGYIRRVEFLTWPENAQLSRLRVLTAEVRRDGNLSRLSQHLDGLPARSREQFSRRRLTVKGAPFTWEQWLRQRVEKADGLMEIDLDPSRGDLAVAGVAPAVDDALRLEITCQLIDAVLRKAIKTGRPEVKR